MNRVILVGRLTRDPEVRYTQSGKAVSTFSLAVDRRFARNAEANGQPTADFISIVAWDKLAEICGNNLTKGRRIGIEGRIQTRNYEDKDGKRVYVTEVVAEQMEFLDSKPSNGGAAPQGGFQQQGNYQPRQQNTPQGDFGPSIPDSEIPF